MLKSLPIDNDTQEDSDTFYTAKDCYDELVSLNDIQSTKGKKLLLAIMPFGIPGSGKTTFLQSLTKIAATLKWSIASVSSDGVRKETIDKLVAKDPSISRQVAFDKT